MSFLEAKEVKKKLKELEKEIIIGQRKNDLLLDENKPYVELMSLAGLKHENGFGAGGTTVVVLGYVSGILCLINAMLLLERLGLLTMQQV